MNGTAHGVDGVRIAFEANGAGHPLVLLHGSSLSRVIWRGLGYTKALAHHFRVIAVDLRGHGRSEKPTRAAAYRRTLLANDVLAVLDVLDVPTAHVLGYSLGGCVGFTLLTKAPTRVTSFVSLAGPFATPPGSVGRIIVPDYHDALSSGGMTELVRRWEQARGAEFDPPTRLALEANDALAMRALLTATDQDPGVDLDTLRTLDTPTMFITGDRDDLGLGSATQARTIMPRVTSHVLPGRDHSELLRPAADVLRLITPFLQAQTPMQDGPSPVAGPST